LVIKTTHFWVVGEVDNVPLRIGCTANLARLNEHTSNGDWFTAVEWLQSASKGLPSWYSGLTAMAC